MNPYETPEQITDRMITEYLAERRRLRQIVGVPKTVPAVLCVAFYFQRPAEHFRAVVHPERPGRYRDDPKVPARTEVLVRDAFKAHRLPVASVIAASTAAGEELKRVEAAGRVVITDLQLTVSWSASAWNGADVSLAPGLVF